MLAVVSALAVGLWLSALNVEYRDVRYALPFLSQFWLLASPVGYSSALIGDGWRWLYALNPMVGVIEGFRWALLGNAEGLEAKFSVSVAVVVMLLVGGLYYFRRMEKTFADVV
jgi:lipopolysaccharide transport system permease protein